MKREIFSYPHTQVFALWKRFTRQLAIESETANRLTAKGEQRTMAADLKSAHRQFIFPLHKMPSHASIHPLDWKQISNLTEA